MFLLLVVNNYLSGFLFVCPRFTGAKLENLETENPVPAPNRKLGAHERGVD